MRMGRGLTASRGVPRYSQEEAGGAAEQGGSRWARSIRVRFSLAVVQSLFREPRERTTGEGEGG